MGLRDLFKLRSTQNDRMLAEFVSFIDQLEATQSLHPIVASIALKKDEFAYLEANCQLHETRSVRYSSSSGRVGFRVMNGDYIGSGDSSPSQSQQAVRCIDHGVLTLTNCRLVFNGSKENRVIPIEKIFSLQQFADGIGISSETRTKTLYFKSVNPHIWKAVYELVTKTGPFGSTVRN